MLDILTDCILHPFITGSRETRDSAYGFIQNRDDDSPHELLSAKIDSTIEKHGKDLLEERFMDAYDAVRAIIDAPVTANMSFVVHLAASRVAGVIVRLLAAE